MLPPEAAEWRQPLVHFFQWLRPEAVQPRCASTCDSTKPASRNTQVLGHRRLCHAELSLNLTNDCSEDASRLDPSRFGSATISNADSMA